VSQTSKLLREHGLPEWRAEAQRVSISVDGEGLPGRETGGGSAAGGGGGGVSGLSLFSGWGGGVASSVLGPKLAAAGEPKIRARKPQRSGRHRRVARQAAIPGGAASIMT